jgi:ABC-type transport system involved in multi-copper enzyme maturation permease subunit
VRDELLAVGRLDLAEVLRSRWLLVCLAVYGLLAAVFVLVGLRESAVLGFTGMGRVLFSMCHALVLILPLLALAVTGQVINRARDDGALELLLSQPIRRSSYFLAVSAVRYLALTLPLLALLVGLGAYGRLAYGHAIPWDFVARSGAISASLLWAFTGLGLATSVLSRSLARTLTYLVLFWVAGVALLDFALIGLMLQWRLNPQAVFLLAALNPVQAARMALLSSADAELATLGPVGFYLSNQLGPSLLFALGLAWPALFGTAAWTTALRSFRRGDLV